MNSNGQNIILLLLFTIGIIIITFFLKSKYTEEFNTSGQIMEGGYIFYPNTNISKNVKDIIIFGMENSEMDGQVPWTNYIDFKSKCNSISNCIGFNTSGYFFKDSPNITDSSNVITPFYSYGKSSDTTVGFYMRTKIPTMPTTLTQARLDEINSFFTSVEKQVNCASNIANTNDIAPPPDEELLDYIDAIDNTITEIEKDISMLEKLIPPSLEFGKIDEGSIPSIAIVGDPPNQKIDLMLVRGESGPIGKQGKVGASGDEGDTGAKGEQGTTGKYAIARNPNIR